MEPARPSRFLSFPVVLSIDLETHLPSTSQLTSEPDAPLARQTFLSPTLSQDK